MAVMMLVGLACSQPKVATVHQAVEEYVAPRCWKPCSNTFDLFGRPVDQVGCRHRCTIRVVDAERRKIQEE
jgi:hypothetical protein